MAEKNLLSVSASSSTGVKHDTPSNITLHGKESEACLELMAKPKLTCILDKPATTGTSSGYSEKPATKVVPSPEIPEKSWSVLFVGSMCSVDAKNLLM